MDQGKHAKVVLDDAETPTASDGEVRVKVAVIALEDESRQEFSRWFFEEYVPKGLESGLIVPTRPQVLEGGLSNVQHTLDLMAQGAVSGRNLIMYP
jgi:hypothetical protein